MKKQQKKKVAWLALDPKENDPKRFVTYLTSAIYSADTVLAKGALEALESEKSAEEVFQLLLNEISDVKEDVYLALEDLHHLNDPEVMQNRGTALKDESDLSLPPLITFTLGILICLFVTSTIFLNNFDFFAFSIECINKGLFL